MRSLLYINHQQKFFGGFNKNFSDSKFVLFGVPFDSTSSYRPGSRFGPSAIREASVNIETWSWRSNNDFENIGTHDLGDLAIVHGDCNETIRRVSEVIKEIVNLKKIPIMIGGEHTITLGVAKSLKDITILSFDAHFDMRYEYLSNKLSHACIMRRIIEEIGSENTIVVGVRAACKEEIEFVKNNNIYFISSKQINMNSAKNIGSILKEKLKNKKKIYISIDMDVLDPSYAPGVGNPEPEGISVSALLDIIEEVIDDRILGFDVVEVTPLYDNGITSIVASKIIYEICCIASRFI
jgi:agmatinase